MEEKRKGEGEGEEGGRRGRSAGPPTLRGSISLYLS